MSQHLASDLKQMQSLPLEIKIIMTQRRIREWYEYYNGQVYVSFSGGKDSTVLKHIVDQMYSDVPALFVNTGLEYPEIQKFAMNQKNVITVRPKMRFDEVIKKYGYLVISKEVAKIIYYARKDASWALNKINGLNKDGSYSSFCQRFKKYQKIIDSDIPISNYCCEIIKKKPVKEYKKQTGRKPMIGTMACESQQRMTGWMKTGCNTFESTEPKSRPLSFWTEQDILHYIKKYNVPYCSVYGDIVEKPHKGQADQIVMTDCIGCYDEADQLTTTGCDRTGCIFCMFGCHLEKEPNRFQRLKTTHPKQYDYCINGGEYNDQGMWQPSKSGLGLGKVLDYIGVKY